MTIKTVLVDDESLARLRMRELLKVHPDINIVGEFASGAAARTALASERPDLMLLDVQMPRIDGFQLLQMLGEAPTPLVIFVTAHESFALEAFDTRAIDYLLKPVRPERLARALNRAREQLAANAEPTNPASEDRGKQIRRLMVKVGEKVIFIQNEQIDWIESAGNYVIVHAGQERHIIRETMNTLERELPQSQFVRLNRSLIVNINRITELVSVGPGEYAAVLAGGKKANVAMALRELEQRLRYSE